jgi:hypothetical protein
MPVTGGSVKHRALPAAFFEFLARPAEARVIASGFSIDPNERAGLRRIGASLAQKIPVHLHYASGGPDQQLFAPLIVDRFFVGAHFGIGMVLMGECPDRDHRATVFFIVEQFRSNRMSQMCPRQKSISPVVPEISALEIFQHQGEIDIFAIKLVVHMIPVAVDQLHKALRLVNILKNEIIIFRFAALNNRQIFAWHHKVWAARKCCKIAIQSLGVGYGTANNTGEIAIHFGIFGIGKL